jgi:HEAT repeat protein
LQEELSSPAISARLRAIEMALAMAATEDVEPSLIELTRHENAAVRKEAILALGHNHGADTIRTLELALLDPNCTIAEAAQKSLTLVTRGRAPSPEQTADSWQK